MIVLYGTRTARIKKFSDNQNKCECCGAFDFDVEIYRNYFHLFFIPVFPFGDKTVKKRCRNCGEIFRLSSLQDHYESISMTPIYLYTVPILFIALVVIMININISTQKEKVIFIDNPQVGDVYMIRNDENNSRAYYFLRVAAIKGDTVIAYHNNLLYHSFVTKLNDDDYFVKDEEMFFLKSEIKEMLERMEINSVERKYGNDTGYNRIK